MNHKINIFMIISLVIISIQSAPYPLIQYYTKDLPQNYHFRVLLACKISDDKIFMSTAVSGGYYWRCPLFANQQCIQIRVYAPQDVRQFYLTTINNIDYLIFMLLDRICVELEQQIEGENYFLCNNSKIIEDDDINYQNQQELIFIEQLSHSTNLYTIVDQISLTKYTIDQQGNIGKDEPPFILQPLPSGYQFYSIALYQDFACVVINSKKTSLQMSYVKCYHFFNRTNFTLSIWKNKSDNILFLTNQIIYGTTNPLQMEKVRLFKLKNISYDEANTYYNVSQIQNIGISGKKLYFNNLWNDIYFLRSQFQAFRRLNELYVFQIVNDEVLLYQILPETQDINRRKLKCRNQTFSLFYGPQAGDMLIVQKISTKQQINLTFYYYFLVVFIAFSLSLAVFSLFKYNTQTRFYCHQIATLVIQELVTICLHYVIFFILIITNDGNQNLSFTTTNKNSTLDSSFPRWLYYCFLSNSLVNSLFIIFHQKTLTNQFTHLLAKHNFNLYIISLAKYILVIIKSFIYSTMAILFISAIQAIYSPPFQLFLALSSFNENQVSILITFAICMMTLSAITYIIIQISFSNWYSIQLTLILYFSLSFITEQLFKFQSTESLQFILIYLSPFTLFQTVVQAVLKTKVKYAYFRKNYSINYIFIVAVIQLFLFSVIALVMVIKRIRKTSFQQLIKSKSMNHSMLTSLRELQDSSQPISSDQPILNVFIPCKISIYNGLQKKKILDNIDFKGFKNQIISFIDYKNQSKNVLIKILINDEKSDAQLQQDLNENIFYSKSIKLGLCHDKNIFCEYMNAIEHLQIFLSLKNKSISQKEKKRQVQYMLNEFNITDQDSVKKVQLLSGGTQKKLCLACAFIGNPDVVILNDPTMGLDIRFKRIFWQRIKEWKEDKLIIVTTSDKEEAEMISDQIWIINNGKMQDYLTFKSTKYFELTLQFFTQAEFSTSKAIVNSLFQEKHNLKFEQALQGSFLYKLQIYDIKNQTILSKIPKLIKQLDSKIRQNYYFYFRTYETKFTIQQFYKYCKFLSQGFLEQQENNVYGEMCGIIHEQVMHLKQLNQDYKMNENQTYHQKEIKNILIQLSNISRISSNIHIAQIKSILKHKINLIKNQKLLIRQISLIFMFFWLALFTYYAFQPDNSNTNPNINQQNTQKVSFYIRITILYCFFMTSLIFKTLAILQSESLLSSLGMNFRNIWVGEWIFGTCYIYSVLFINLTIYILYSLVFSSIKSHFVICYLTSLLYIANYTLWTLVILILTKNKQRTILILMIIIIFPAYAKYDLLLINYPNNSILIKQILSYIIFPVTLSSFYQTLQQGQMAFKFILVLIYQILFPIGVLLLYQMKGKNNGNSQDIMIGEIKNIANDAIMQEQRLVYELFQDKSIVLGHNICKKYPFQHKNEPSLRNVYFHCKRGQILAFVGHNACGKTTLFNIITGKLKKTYGKIEVLGKKEQQLIFQDKLYWGLCTQKGYLFDGFTVQQNIRFIGLIKGLQQKYISKFTIKLLKYFKLYNKQKALINELSEGERKKLCVIISFLGLPSFIVFDEPTSFIDTESKVKFMDLIKNYSSMFNAAILITTHNISEAESYSHRVAILKKGYLCQVGFPSELIKHPSQELYRLVIWFKFNQKAAALQNSKKCIMNFIRELTYIDIIREDGLRFIYGLDMLRINMQKILMKMMKMFEEQKIDKFDLYKYDLQQVVKYNMSVDQNHRLRQRNEENKAQNMIKHW